MREEAADVPVYAWEGWLLYDGKSLEPKHLECGDEDVDGFCEARN
jgi:hypothetical protein